MVNPDNRTIYTVNQGDNITILCEAVGIPAPILSFMPGPDMQSSETLSRILYSSTSNSYVIDEESGEILQLSTLAITLTYATNEDSGVYECTANSTQTSQSDTVTIEFIVQSK